MKILSKLFFLTLVLTSIKINAQQKTSKDIYELAINIPNEGKAQAFLESRKKFVSVLDKEKATLNEGKWKPFFTVDESLDIKNILVGITHWNSLQGFEEAAQRLLPQKEAVDYFSTFTPKTYVLLETLDGKPFNIESIKKNGNVVEFAVRKGKSDAAFGSIRNDFFKSLKKFRGYKFSREFKVYTLNDKGIPTPAENTQAVIIVWENVTDFQNAVQAVFVSKEYQIFESAITLQSYFATFPTE